MIKHDFILEQLVIDYMLGSLVIDYMLVHVRITNDRPHVSKVSKF